MHNEEVSWETHRLHNVQLKAYSVVDLFRKRVAVALCRALVGQLGQIVGLKLHTVYLVVAAQLLYLLLGILGWQWVLTVLVAGKLLVQVFLGELLSPLFLGTKTFRDREERHDWVGVQTVCLHLI